MLRMMRVRWVSVEPDDVQIWERSRALGQEGGAERLAADHGTCADPRV